MAPARKSAPSAAIGSAPMPQAMPSPMSRKRTVTSLGSSTGVRKRMIPAAPAMPKARASELPMMIMMRAPATASSTCACSIDRFIGRSFWWSFWTWVTNTAMTPADRSCTSSENGYPHGVAHSAPDTDSGAMRAPPPAGPACGMRHTMPMPAMSRQTAIPSVTMPISRHLKACCFASWIES